MHKLISIAFCVTISGCATIYIPPTTKQSPTLSIVSSMSVLRIFENGENCSGPIRIPDGYMSERRLKAMPIYENKEIALHSGWATLTKACQLMVSFNPKEQSDYELNFFIDDARQQCGATLHRKDRQTNLVSLDRSLKLRKRTTPFLESQPFCAPFDEKQ